MYMLKIQGLSLVVARLGFGYPKEAWPTRFLLDYIINKNLFGKKGRKILLHIFKTIN